MLPAPKHIPLNANCQLNNADCQNCQLQPNGAILAKPNFKKTCPAVNNTLWIIARNINFGIKSH